MIKCPKLRQDDELRRLRNISYRQLKSYKHLSTEEFNKPDES